MKELIGLKVKLLSNGDITIIDSPEDHIKECFGLTHGSQQEIIGTVTEAEPRVEISDEWLEKTSNGEWSNNTPIQYEVRIYVGISFNSPQGIKIGHWSLLPSRINYLLNK